MIKAKIKTLKIDDKIVNGRSDQTILEVAKENGIEIPTLCNLEGLTPYGGCRLCLVEIVGTRGFTPACTTKIKSDIEVYTNTTKLQEYRKNILSLLFAERNHTCSVCVSNGDCQLQSLAVKLGVDHIEYEYLYPHFDIDASHELFVSDPNKCVLCTRCVRVCSQIEGASSWNVINRGVDSKTVIDMGGLWIDSDTCTSCGKCVQVCPTGAIYKKGATSGTMHKKGTFLPYLLKNRGDV